MAMGFEMHMRSCAVRLQDDRLACTFCVPLLRSSRVEPGYFWQMIIEINGRQQSAGFASVTVVRDLVFWGGFFGLFLARCWCTLNCRARRGGR